MDRFNLQSVSMSELVDGDGSNDWKNFSNAPKATKWKINDMAK